MSAKTWAALLAILAGSPGLGFAQSHQHGAADSDIYIVYSDLQQTGLPQAVFAPSDRQLVAKMNYLLTR